MAKEFAIAELRPSDVEVITRVGRGNGWNVDPTIWAADLSQHNSGERLVLVARRGSDIAAYGTLLWRSTYAPFATTNTPEIHAMVVAEFFRRRGIATAMIGAFERAARDAGRSTIGIGVGLYADYGPAQLLYAKLGFRPDGNGATYKDQPVKPGVSVPVDDHLTLRLIKPL